MSDAAKDLCHSAKGSFDAPKIGAPFAQGVMMLNSDFLLLSPLLLSPAQRLHTSTNVRTTANTARRHWISVSDHLHVESCLKKGKERESNVMKQLI